MIYQKIKPSVFLIVLFIAFSLCPAQSLTRKVDSLTVKLNEIEKRIDSLITKQNNTEKSITNIETTTKSLNKTISDDITTTLLEKAQGFYSTSFDKIQSSYDIFLVIITIYVTVITALVGYIKIKAIPRMKKITKNLENYFKTLEKQRKRDFLRAHYYNKMFLESQDKDTVDVIVKIQDEMFGGNKEKMIPYLEELYERMKYGYYWEKWRNSSKEGKEEAFKKIIEQVDSDWGEEYVRNGKK